MLAAPAQAKPPSGHGGGGTTGGGLSGGIGDGVNGGLANDDDSCLGSQWTYAVGSAGGTKQAKAQAYLNTGDPGNGVADWPSPANYGAYPEATLSTPYGSCTYASGSGGPGAMSPACAYVYGYDMVVGGINDGPGVTVQGDLNAFRNATGASLATQPVWLDVETGNSWQTGAAGLQMNTADLNGMVAALRAANSGATVGVYSTAYQWNQIPAARPGPRLGTWPACPIGFPEPAPGPGPSPTAARPPSPAGRSASPSGRRANSTTTTPASAKGSFGEGVNAGSTTWTRHVRRGAPARQRSCRHLVCGPLRQRSSDRHSPPRDWRWLLRFTNGLRTHEVGSTFALMGFGYRKSVRLGPFRLTASKRGLSESVGLDGVRLTRGATGRRTKSVQLPGGLFWRSSRRG